MRFTTPLSTPRASGDARHRPPGRRPARALAAPGQLLRAAVLAGLAACADQPTDPGRAADPAARPAQVTYDVWRPRGNAERVTVTRTTETVETRGGRPGSKGRRVRVTTLGQDVAAVKEGERAPRGSRRPSAESATELPPVGLSVAARRGAAAAQVAWRNRHPLAGVPGVEVESEGVGDAPATTLRFYQDGALARTVTQAYRHRAGRWELQRRETTTPDGSLRDVVVVERSGGPAAVELPFDRPGAADDRWADAWTFPGAALPGEDCEPCAGLLEARNAAFESFLWQELAAIVVCAATPPPADALACSAAAIKVVEAWSRYTRADVAYDRCMSNPPKCPCPRADAVVAAAARAAGGVSGVPWAGPPGMQAGAGDCDDPPATGGGGETGRTPVTTCYYEIWYDVDTGEILYSELLYCETT